MLKQILFIWLCFSALTLFGQSLIDIKYYSVQDGLSQKNIQNLIQDDNGYIWMSTWNGLERFDGYSFTNYKTYPGSKVRIANHRFTKIEKSSLNNIWCQTYDKHCYLFNTRTYQYEDPFLFNKSLVNSVEKLYVLRKGITWAVGTQNELFRMDENKFPDMESVQLYTGKTENSIGDSIYTIIQDKDGDEWILTNKGTTIVGKKSIANLMPFKFMVENADDIYLATSKGFFARYDYQNQNVVPCVPDESMFEIIGLKSLSDQVDAPVEDFETGRIDKDKKIRVRRFNDTYHNEAVIGKMGIVDKKWADRLMLGFTYSHMYKEIQTGVRQEIVYGEKHRKGYSLMPSLEYSKRGLFIKGLDVALTANYNKNATTNIDTASYKYNWLGDRKLMNSPGEQSNQYSRADNNNWNGTLTVNYRLAKIHMLTFNHVLNTFRRSNTSLLAKMESEDAIAKETHKNISGLSYRLMPSDNWNLSVFGKYYSLYVAGPMATTTNQDDYVRTTRNMNSIGYGAAGTYFILPGLQAKLSYEKAYRLPTIEEMFGDEDLEMGDISIKPESSDNLNFNLSYNRTFGRHSVYMEGGVIYRNTKDYIQRNIADLSGGKYAAKYINYGKVLTKGYTVSARYGFGNWVSIGGNFTKMDVRDNMKTSISSSAENLAYKERMPNLPYMFADSDVTFYWRDLGRKGNMLTVSYDNQYLHSFTYYSSRIGSNKGDYVVPDQFSHNISFSYSLQKGRYNVSLECRNFTDEKLYDNFSLQKAGRAFYGKLRVCFGN